MQIRAGLQVPEARLRQLCAEHAVSGLWLFGSSVRGEARPDSDVDLLVEYTSDAHAGLIELASLQFELSDLLGKPVDLVPRDGLKPRIRDAVMSEARALFLA